MIVLIWSKYITAEGLKNHQKYPWQPIPAAKVIFGFKQKNSGHLPAFRGQAFRRQSCRALQSMVWHAYSVLFHCVSLQLAKISPLTML